jgi:hypothetical protein
MANEVVEETAEGEIDVEANTFASGNVVAAVQGLNDSSIAGYSSIKADDFKTKLTVLDAMNNSTPLDEYLNQPFELKDIIVTVVHLADQKTGEVKPQPRIVLIDSTGTARHATSTGLMQSVTTLIGVLGEPHTWPAPVKAKVVKEGNGTNKYFTLKLV